MTKNLMTMKSTATAPENPLDLTLDQALARFAARYLTGRNLAERTRVEYLADLRDAVAFLRDGCDVTRAAAVEPGHLEGYLSELDRRGLKGSTRRRKATSLRVFFRFLHQQGHLPASPADQLVPPAKESALPRFLSEVEYKRLLAAARHR